MRVSMRRSIRTLPWMGAVGGCGLRDLSVTERAGGGMRIMEPRLSQPNTVTPERKETLPVPRWEGFLSGREQLPRNLQQSLGPQRRRELHSENAQVRQQVSSSDNAGIVVRL